MVNRKKSNKMMIDNDYFYGMGEYVDSYQGGMINPFSERTVPRSPSQALLTTKYDLASNRSSEVNGGFVHRPVKYRGIGAGMSNDEVEGGKFGLTKKQGDAFFQGTKYITQPVKALGAIASMTPLAPYALPITVGMTAYEQLVKSLSGNGMNNYEGGDFFDGFNKALHLRPSQRLSEKKVKKAFDTTNKNIITPMATATKYIAPLLGPYGLPVSAALGAVGYGEPFKNKPRMTKRAQIVKRIMNERGVSMIQASKIVKNEGLY